MFVDDRIPIGTGSAHKLPLGLLLLTSHSLSKVKVNYLKVVLN